MARIDRGPRLECLCREEQLEGIRRRGRPPLHDALQLRLAAKLRSVLDDGAFVFRTRVYYTKGRLYQTIFSNPGLNGMPAGMDQYFDGLAAKFLNSFKIGA